MKQILMVILVSGIIFSGSAFAQNLQEIEIVISSSNYNYGENLDYTIVVEEITGEDAVIFITDTIGNKSQLYSIQIFENETRIIAPFAFDSIIWSEGTYQLELHYSGAVSSTEFIIENDGTIGIPYWIKDISKLWVNGQTGDPEFAKTIQFLIDEKIIFNPSPGKELHIPEWFKFTTAWWTNNQIPDTIYGYSLQFLIDEKVITVPVDQKSFSQDLSSDKTL
ncbi:MAG: hypothetical protein CL686_00620 [Candidatus Nitrosopelagicus sp.]|nr:hypothetical protein [Candidatus Nitrosopelagicus sp.]